MNIYDEALLSIEGLPHTIKVPLRHALKRAKKEHKLLDIYREQSNAFMDEDFTKAIILQNDINILEAILEEIK